MTEEAYVFVVEWHDVQAEVLRRYTLTYFPRDNSIEMYDTKCKRSFLKRSEYPGVSLSDLYPGAMVTIHSRQLKVIEYGNGWTRSVLEAKKASAIALIKPDAYNHMGLILNAAYDAGFVIARLAMIRMTPQQASKFCEMQNYGADAAEHAAHLQADVCVVMELIGDGAVEEWGAICGPESPWQAQADAPRSLRALYGSDDIRNAIHASRDGSSARAEVDFFFGKGQSWPTTALFNNCTLCVVRPHALKASGDIVGRILAEGFEISAMRLWKLDKSTSEEFLEVYKGVLPEYLESCAHMITGPCLVMEVRQQDAVATFRELVGPHDPEVAKHLRPKTLRALFGEDRVRNAVHCTDLPEDGLLEVEYFFNILLGREN